MAAVTTPLGAPLLLFVTLLSAVLFAESAFDMGRRRLQMRKLAMCKGKETLPIRWHNVTTNFVDDTNDMVLGLTMEVVTEVSYNFSMAFNFWKCDASGNPDSCEFVIKNYVNKEVCRYLGMKNQAWTVFIDHFDKPVVCPIKPGEYKLLDLPINTEFLKKLPVGDAVWKVKLWGYDLAKTLSCVDMEIQLVSLVGPRRG